MMTAECENQAIALGITPDALKAVKEAGQQHGVTWVSAVTQYDARLQRAILVFKGSGPDAGTDYYSPIIME